MQGRVCVTLPCGEISAPTCSWSVCVHLFPPPWAELGLHVPFWGWVRVPSPARPAPQLHLPLEVGVPLGPAVCDLV